MSDWKNVQYKDGKFKTGPGGGGGGASTIAGLDDVNITSATDGQVLKYDEQNEKWVNANESSGSGHAYSTTEQVVGTWYNGKTIYEKVYVFSSGMSLSVANWTQPSPAIDSSNIEDVIGVTCIHSDGTCYNYCGADPTRDSHAHLGFKGGEVGTAYKAIVQYTKITD